MEIWGAGKFSSAHRGYQVKEDAIWIFLNYEKVGIYKDKSLALKKINELIQNAPSDFSEFRDYLKLD